MTHRHRKVALATLLASSFVAAAGAQDDPGDWPQFRGRRVDGIARASGVLSRGAAPALDVTWRARLGSGYSGVSVAGGLAVTMFSDGESNVLAAFDSRTGEERWRLPYSPVYKGHDGSYDGPIATPAITGGRTVALGPNGLLFAVDNVNGELLWSVDFVEDLGAPVPLYGFASSPVVMDGVVVVQAGSDAGTVTAFDPANGRKLWSVGTDGVNAQTPVPMMTSGRERLIAAGDTSLFALDAASGDVAWTKPHGGSDVIGAWALVPVAAGAERLFLNHTGHSSTGVDLSGAAGVEPLPELWESRNIRNTYAIPVYHEGYLYGFASRFLTCLDAATGEAVWKSRPPGDGFLILVDGHLVILTKDGGVHIAKASPAGYEEIAARPVFEDLAWAPPSFAEGSLFVRSHGELARVEIGAARPRITTDVDGSPEPGAAGAFGRFLRELDDADDKPARVDAFFAEQDRFPLVEDDGTVHFVYRGDADDMAIGGDMVGARQEKSMTRVSGTDLFYYTTEIRRDAFVSYVFIKDYQEMLTDPRNPRTARWAILGKDMAIDTSGGFGEPMDVSVARDARMDRARSPEPAPPSRHHAAASCATSSTAPRSDGATSFDVYLPSEYDESGDRRYPVLYYHGGVRAGDLGELTRTLDQLTGDRVEPAIVVLMSASGGHIFMPRARDGAHWAEELGPVHRRHLPDARRPGVARERRCGLLWARRDLLRVPLPGALVPSRGAVSRHGRRRPRGARPLHPERGRARPSHPSRMGCLRSLFNPHEVIDVAARSREFGAFLADRGYHVTTRENATGMGWPAWRTRTDAVLESVLPRDAAGR